MKPSGLGLFFVGSFLNTDLILLVAISLFTFSILSCFRLGRLHIPRNLSIFSVCTIQLVQYVYSIFLKFFVSLSFWLSLLFHFWFISAIPLFSWWVWLKIYLLFIFSRNQLLVLLHFILFIDSILFISTLIFIIFFVLLPLCFVFFSFPSSFCCKFRLFIW